MATFQELQDRVRANIIDLPLVVSNSVGTLVNQAIASLEKKHDFKINEVDTGLLVTATYTRVLAVTPSTFVKPRGNPFLIKKSGEVIKLHWAPNRTAVVMEYGTDAGGSALPADVAGRPKHIHQSEPISSSSNLEVWPFSDGLSDYADGQYRIVIPYWKTLSDLTVLSSTNWFTNNADLFLEMEATSMAFYKDWDEERGTLWKQRAQEYVKDIIRLDKLHRLGGVNTLVPHWDVDEARLPR